MRPFVRRTLVLGGAVVGVLVVERVLERSLARKVLASADPDLDPLYELPPDAVAFGYVNMLGLLALHQSQALSPTPGAAGPEDPGKLAENLVTFLVAAFDHGLGS